MSDEVKEVKKGRKTSLPLLIGFLVLGVIGYFAGPTIMVYGFYLQEKFIARSMVGEKTVVDPDRASSTTAAAPSVEQ